MAFLTLIGLYNYDNTLFADLTLPDGLDRDICINTMLMRSGEFEIMYPDANFMKAQIAMWSRRHLRTFQKWVDALSITYNPLENYDRMEEYIDTHKDAEVRQESGENASTADNNTTGARNTNVSDTQAIVSDVTEKQVSAYDSSIYVPSEKDSRSSSATQGTQTSDVSNTGSHTSGGGTYSNGGVTNREGSVEHEARLHGNIGVTTSQQMLQAELDVQRFNLYDNIADLFVEEFCIMVY